MDQYQDESFEPIYTKATRRDTFKKSSTKERADIKDAVWQYLVDHSVLTRNGFHIKLTARDKKTFFSRVASREHGFQKTDAKAMSQKVDTAFHKKEVDDINALAFSMASRTAPYSWLLRLRKLIDTPINTLIRGKFVKIARAQYYKNRQTIYDVL